MATVEQKDNFHNPHLNIDKRWLLVSVKECTVVPAPDAKWGEVVQAVVVLKRGTQATAEEIIEHCKKNLAGYKCPKAVAFWDDIPKTVVGKILKKDVKKKFWEGKERMIS